MRKLIVLMARVAAGFAWSRSRGRAEGAARFVDTFRWQLSFGY